MPERPLESAQNLVPVDIHTFRTATRNIDFDVFLKLSEDNVVHVFSRTTGLDYKRLAQYIQKGVRTLFIHPGDQEAFQAFIARPAAEVFSDPSTPPEKKIAILLNMTEQNMAELFSQIAVEDETASNTQKIIKSYVNLMIQKPETLATILKLVSHGEYLYYHSIAVAIFSMFLAKASGQFNQRTLEIVGLGGFLHDIGCTQLPKEVVSSSTDLTEDQWKLMHSHPKLGLKMIESTPSVPDEVRYIVYQHHEQPSGRGYPNGLTNPVIYYPAKIVALADSFSSLISNRPFRKAYSVEEAIHLVEGEVGKFDRGLVQLLGSIFLRRSRTSGSGNQAA